MKSSIRDMAKGKLPAVKGQAKNAAEKDLASKLVVDVNSVEDVNNLITIE